MIRLDKLLCHAGYGTRKEVKKLIRSKLVTINGELAKKDDIILLLGKAHENSIIYKDFVMPYDEISEAEKALSEMGY